MKVALIGLKNFGIQHFRPLKRLHEEGVLTFTAACSRSLDNLGEEQDEFYKKYNIPLYNDYNEMLKEHQLDLVTVSTGIHLHSSMSVDAMAAGANVYCEKPPAPTVSEVQKMVDASKEYNKLCVIGFNWQAGEQLHFVLDYIFNKKELGRVLRVNSIMITNRANSYYERTAWAGKINFEGQVVNDGTINNPFAHHIAMCLQMAAKEYGKSAAPVSVDADMYHIRDIETEDTTAINIKTDTGIEIHAVTSNAAEPGTDNRTIKVVCEKGYIEWDSKTTVNIMKDGKLETLTFAPAADHQYKTYKNIIKYLDGDKDTFLYTVEEGIKFTKVIEEAFKDVKVKQINPENRYILEIKGNTYQCLKDIYEIALKCYNEDKFYKDLNLNW